VLKFCRPAFAQRRRDGGELIGFFGNRIVTSGITDRSVVSGSALLFYKIAGQNEKCAAYQKSARYWLHYIFNAPRRRRLHRQRNQEISRMKFDLCASPLA